MLCKCIHTGKTPKKCVFMVNFNHRQRDCWLSHNQNRGSDKRTMHSVFNKTSETISGLHTSNRSSIHILHQLTKVSEEKLSIQFGDKVIGIIYMGIIITAKSKFEHVNMATGQTKNLASTFLPRMVCFTFCEWVWESNVREQIYKKTKLSTTVDCDL